MMNSACAAEAVHRFIQTNTVLGANAHAETARVMGQPLQESQTSGSEIARTGRITKRRHDAAYKSRDERKRKSSPVLLSSMSPRTVDAVRTFLRRSD